jgi:hypothetical protein
VLRQAGSKKSQQTLNEDARTLSAAKEGKAKRRPIAVGRATQQLASFYECFRL